MYVFPFVIGKSKWPNKPNKMDIANICQSTSHYIEREATIEQACKWVLEGRCWRAATLVDYSQPFTKKNTKEAYIIALDFDMCDIEPLAMVEYCETIGLRPNLWYYSFSQGIKPKNNYRIVWFLDGGITIDKYERIYKGLLQDSVFCNSDKSCSNINRLWFGTNKGGEIVGTEPTASNKFDIYALAAVKNEPKKEKKIKQDLEQGQTQQEFIMDSVSFPWWLYLADVCDLWDRWRKGVYLNYNQRLVLFTELKSLKYADNLRESIINKVMEYYKQETYDSHTCDRRQISEMMSRHTINNLKNKIVKFGNNEYTICEYFTSGAYKIKGQAQQGIRITPEELTQRADAEIPALLGSKGIQYIECQTGAGKTERIINYLKSIDLSKKKIVYSVPTYALIDEFIERLQKIDFDMSYIHYPKQQDYTEAELLLLEAGFYEGIKADNERQKELKKVYEPNIRGLFLLTHSCLTHLHSFEANTIIIDENIEETIVNKNAIPLAILSGMRYFVAEKGRNELDKLCGIIDGGEPQEPINTKDIDISLIFDNIDYIRLVKEQSFVDIRTGLVYPFGKLRQADKMAIGADKDGNKYLYFEIISKLIPYALANNVSVKLFTGTAKKETMRLSMPPSLAEHIQYCVIDRAKPKGKLYQYKEFTGSKYSLQKESEWRHIIKLLEDNGVNWRQTNCLTLKRFEEQAAKLGFQIPHNRKGESIHIENCAGLDFMKGQDLIIIGKADKPKEAYFDMVGNVTTKSQSTRARIFEDIAGYHNIHGFNDEQLWQLQAEQMRQMVEQAADRARTLWYSNVRVYVFCDLPIRDAEYLWEV